MRALAMAACIAVISAFITCTEVSASSAGTEASFPVYVQSAAGQFSSGASQNYIYDSVSGKRVKVLPANCGGLRFSPTGDRALARCQTSSLNGLYILFPSSRKPLRLIAGVVSKNLESGAFSPSGKTVVFAEGPLVGGSIAVHLFRVSAAGGKAKQLTFGAAADEDPIFTPNGRWILFERTNPAVTQTAIFAVPATGGSPHLVGAPTHGTSDLVGGVSPDGSTLLWRDTYSIHTEGFNDSTATVTGSPPDQVLLDDVSGGGGLWSPDGSQIGYGRQANLNALPAPHAAIANADGSGERVISHDTAGHASLVVAWLPARAAAKWER